MLTEMKIKTMIKELEKTIRRLAKFENLSMILLRIKTGLSKD